MVDSAFTSADLEAEPSILPVTSTALFPGPWLILAPHPDDETFGMGGTIRRAVAAGIDVSIVILTDGAAGGASDESSVDLVAQRASETVKALTVLGVDPAAVFFLGEPDRGIRFSEFLIRRVMNIALEKRVRGVFFPHPFEPHPDHRMTACIGWALRRRVPGVVAVMYEISVQGVCNRLMDVTAEISFKQQAMGCFKSQEHGDYMRRVLALNESRSWSLPPPASHAEAFHEWPAFAEEETLGAAVSRVVRERLGAGALGLEAVPRASLECDNCQGRTSLAMRRVESSLSSSTDGITKLLIGRARTVLRALPGAVRRAGGWRELWGKSLTVYRRSGWSGVKERARALAWGQADAVAPPEAAVALGLDPYRAIWEEGFALAAAVPAAAAPAATGDAVATRIRALAFYLPQFHPIAENDAWWGKGFTEWTNVAKARPQFVGHQQPRLPSDLGYYDLRVPEVMDEQIALARHHGIHGFCFYHYWFSGDRLLEHPVEQFLADPVRFDMPFCLCWANENWTRRWDGAEHDVLMAQQHADGDEERFIAELIPALRDARYIRIDGRPLLLVYRIDQLPQPRRAIETWRAGAREAGIGELHIAVVQSFEIDDPREYGADSAVEFPPHKLMLPHWNEHVTLLNPDYEGIVFSYEDVIRTKLAETPPAERPYRWFRGLMPSWDNEARKPGRGYSFAGSTPEHYARWLEALCEQADQAATHDDERIVFINAWNEWGEGAYLEPDRHYGHAYLHATSEVLRRFPVATGSSVPGAASNSTDAT